MSLLGAPAPLFMVSDNTTSVVAVIEATVRDHSDLVRFLMGTMLDIDRKPEIMKCHTYLC